MHSSRSTRDWGKILPGAEVEERLDDTAVLHRPGDVRFGKLRPYLAKSLHMADHGHGSGELLVLRPRSGAMRGHFLHYPTLSDPFVKWATATSYGVKMPRTSWEALSAYRIDPPGLEEQQRIVDYLDAETARIDELIAEQRTLIDLVADRLAAVREQGFQRGRLRRLKELLIEWPRYGVLVPEFVDKGVPFIRVGDIAAMGRSDVSARAIPLELSAKFSRSVLKGGEVLVSVVGSLGHAGVVPVELAGANVARAVAVLRPKPGELPPELLAHFVLTRIYQDQARLATGTDTAQPTLNMGDLANFTIRLPDDPRAARAMADELIDEAAATRDTSAELNCHIALLQERRRALITHAVTQGIDGLPGAA